jgi:hypothetical protein
VRVGTAEDARWSDCHTHSKVAPVILDSCEATQCMVRRAAGVIMPGNSLV